MSSLDVCATCTAPLRTLRNVMARERVDGLAPVWMPPGGCTCHGVTEAQSNPGCRVCYPATLVCQACGGAA